MSDETLPTETPPAGPAIVPRWEWRTFGESFGTAGERLAGVPPERVEEGDETYFVSAQSDASVKVRGGQMDVKELQHVDENGLEQWRPILKREFPIAATDVGTVLAALAVTAPALERDAYTLEQLIAEVIDPDPDLSSVQVHKHREHHMVDGCMAELSVLTLGRVETHTIAVESPDPALVLKTLDTLGLDPLPNVCMARGLKTLLGLDAVRYAVVDVGTNSVKFHLGERRPSGAWRTIVDRAELTRLGEGIEETGRLSPEPLTRTADAIVTMVGEARANGAAAIAAVGTAGMRIAVNSKELVDAVQQRCGVGIEVISGEEEARLAYVAAVSELDVGKGPLAAFDTGGGSSQFTFGRGTHVDERFSVDVGAVRFTEEFGLDQAVTPDVLSQALAAIGSALDRLDGRKTPDALIGMGGALTNLAAVKHALAAYDPDVVHGTSLDRAEIDRQLELYREKPADERRSIVGLQPGRAEVILAGACIVRTVLEKLGCDSLVVSDRGLRHGLIVERFG